MYSSPWLVSHCFLEPSSCQVSVTSVFVGAPIVVGAGVVVGATVVVGAAVVVASVEVVFGAALSWYADAFLFVLVLVHSVL